MNDDKLLKDRARASQAQEILSSPLLVEGFDNLEAAYIQTWRATRPDDVAAREKLYLAVNVIGKLKEHLQSVIENGRLAEAELKALTDEQQRKKRFGII